MKEEVGESRTRLASLVKYLTPEVIVLDVYSGQNVIEEEKYMREKIKYLTDYWEAHHEDPIEGRMFQPGEVVSVKMGTWRPSLITGFRIVDSMHVYQLVILDCGQIIEVHRTKFRDIPPNVTLQCRYKFVLLNDLLPVEIKKRKYGTWSVESCRNLKLLFDVASAIHIDVQAVQIVKGYERLFGNIYLQVGTEVVDVRDLLLRSNEAFEDAEQFRRKYSLSEEDYNFECRKEVNESEIMSDCEKTTTVGVEKVTDATLDKFLLPEWRIGGNESLTQRQRNSMRYRLVTESHIFFALPSGKSVRSTGSDTPTTGGSQVPGPSRAKSGSSPPIKGDVPNIESEANSAQPDRGTAEIKTTTSRRRQTGKPAVKAKTTRPSPDEVASHVSHEVQVVSGELREKLLKSLFTSPQATPPIKTSSLSKNECINNRKLIQQESEGDENEVPTTPEEKETEVYENAAGIQIVTGELCDKLTKLFSPSDGKPLQQNRTPRFVLNKDLVRGSYSSEKKSEAKWLGSGGLYAATGSSLAVRCAISPTFQQDATKLQLGAGHSNSCKQQIRQASSITVDTASQLLSQTVFAFIEASRSYREAMDELMELLSDDNWLLMMDGLDNEDGHPYNVDVQELWKNEQDTRGKVNTLRNNLLELVSYMECVTKLATAAAEVSYRAGSNFASTSMCERLNSAHRAFEKEKAMNKNTEHKLLKLQVSNAATFGKADAASPPLQPSL